MIEVFINATKLVVVLDSFVVVKQYNRRNAREKGFTQAILPHCSSSLKEARAGTQTGQEPGGRS